MSKRSHPPTLLTLVERTLRDECRLERGERIVVAVSGGPDSQALLHVLARLAPKLGLVIFAHGVDHGLRPEAKHELELAERLAKRLDVPFARTELRVTPGGNLMARARNERYRALHTARSARAASFVATAHHMDDRAETVLERILRGAGPRGLAVLPARSQDLLRPLIRARRSDVHAHLSRHAIEYASDPSNEDRRFLRVRVRHEVLPLLESLSPQVVEHLVALADQLADGPPPVVHDAEGRPVPLGRAQTLAVRRMLEKRSGRAKVSLPGGRSVRFDRRSGQPILVIGEKMIKT